jgi:large subunit ribosomal protein L25
LFFESYSDRIKIYFMKHPILTAEERKILGKKVKQLRRDGLLPANVYGKNLSSIALQVKFSDFQTVYKEVGETGLVDLKVGSESRPVLIKNLQMNYQTRTPLHVDFYQVNLKEKVKTMVPVVLEGEPQAVADKLGMLLQTLNEVEIEALPDKLPENISIDVTALAEVGAGITVADLVAPEGVAILTDGGQTVARIAELVAPEPEPEVAEIPAEEGAETTESSEAEGEEKSSEENKE